MSYLKNFGGVDLHFREASMTKVVLRRSHFWQHYWDMKKLTYAALSGLLVLGVSAPAPAVAAEDPKLPWFCYMGSPIIGICPAEMLK